MIQILASNSSGGFGGAIVAGLAILAIVITIYIGIFIFIIKYIAKEIGKAVSGEFDYDYLAKIVAYEMKKGTTKVTPKKIEPREDTEDE